MEQAWIGGKPLQWEGLIPGEAIAVSWRMRGYAARHNVQAAHGETAQPLDLATGLESFSVS